MTDEKLTKSHLRVLSLASAIKSVDKALVARYGHNGSTIAALVKKGCLAERCIRFMPASWEITPKGREILALPASQKTLEALP